MKLKAQFETELYLSEGDYLCIRQIDGMGEEAIVCLSHDQVKTLAKELAKWAKNGSWWVSEVREDGHDAP